MIYDLCIREKSKQQGTESWYMKPEIGCGCEWTWAMLKPRTWESKNSALRKKNVVWQQGGKMVRPAQSCWIKVKVQCLSEDPKTGIAYIPWTDLVLPGNKPQNSWLLQYISPLHKLENLGWISLLYINRNLTGVVHGSSFHILSYHLIFHLTNIYLATSML